jgi:hypothetical protein
LCDRARKTDDGVEILKGAICKLFPQGPKRSRWLAWAERIQEPRFQAIERQLKFPD